MPIDAVGSIAVVDLEAVCELFGRDMLPYPLGRSRPVGSLWLLTREVGSVDDRLSGGDLVAVRGWAEAFARADACSGCRVSASGEDTPDLRLQGLLAGESGYVAVQHRGPDGVDIVDIYAVPPAAVSAVIADSVGLVGAGSHSRIAVAGLEDRLPALSPDVLEEYDQFGFLIPRAEPEGPPVHIVDGSDVAAIGTVQSVSGETRHFVRIAGDGDYLYAPEDAGYAEPIDTESLRACIDGEMPVGWDGSVGWGESGEWGESVEWDE